MSIPHSALTSYDEAGANRASGDATMPMSEPHERLSSMRK